ncbi:MAG: Flp pilus assembly complex ATPase component TadA, partial [Candidatus Omnitrophica bacterium]|nr:Flp pilus assembly complex ATPase component TadA [Candidatus Omnitrophota bacterium]
MRNLSEKIIEALKASQRVTEKDIQKALAIYAKQGGGTLRDILVQMGLISEKELLSFVSTELKIEFLNLAKYKINPDVGKMIPEKLARKHKVIPVSKIGTTLTLAISDPFNVIAVDDVALFTKHEVRCVLSPEKDILDAVDRLYRSEKEDMTAIAESITLAEGDVEVVKGEEDLSEFFLGSESQEAPVVKMVEVILREALKKRASDIHVEPFEKTVRVRYRIDGALEEVLAIPKKNQSGVLTRIKIMSRLDITENRIPQDGRFKIKLQEKEVDFRVSILPVHFGNKVVMRVLDKSSLSVGLDKLGFSQEALRLLKDAIFKPFGMILVTGPTGSGKSTTLYSILNQLNTPEKNIITIEDPIEYQVRGITQIQTKPEIGFDFANGLRAILRQSPDIVMVGEIRDSETADIGIKASLTGQLVLSTLHTNDASGAITRLVDMGVEPFLISSSVILVIAQRLFRKICPFCRQEVEIPKEVFERSGISIEPFIREAGLRKFYRGRGCEKCNKTGYLGRIAILEMLVMDNRIRDLTIKRASAYEIRDYAVKNGMTVLRNDALRKFCQGITTLDEVLR